MNRSRNLLATYAPIRAFAAAALTLGVLTNAFAGRIVAQPEADYELHLADVQILPQSTAGYLIFKTCPSCETTSMTVSADTIYLVEQQTVSLTEFLQTAQMYRQTDASNTNFYIFYDIASKHVNRVVLSPIR
jgi:hypothetical protein